MGNMMYVQPNPCISQNHEIGRLGETCSFSALYKLKDVGVTVEHQNNFIHN